MAGGRERRLAENEALFRDVNERIQAAAQAQVGSDEHAYTYLCECSNDECAERVRLTRPDYERVRGSGTRFVLVPGHEISEVEDVVERISPEAIVVEKRGQAGAVADSTDPRAA